MNELIQRQPGQPFVVAGEDITDWIGCDFARVLDDGRILLIQERPYNTQLSVTLPQEWPNVKDDQW